MSEFPISTERIILGEYDEHEVNTLVETGLSAYYRCVYPRPDLTIDTDIPSRPWNDTPSYCHNATTNETFYTCHFIHHRLTIRIMPDTTLQCMHTNTEARNSRGRSCYSRNATTGACSELLSIQFMITPCPITDVAETIEEEDEHRKIVSQVIEPIRARLIAHGERCHTMFDEQQTEFAGDRVNFI
jgi:hypothetical protein